MKFDKINIIVEKLGDITIFSYDGYILGFSDWNSSEYISFCPITVNSENIDILDVYLEFIDTCCANSLDGLYPSNYRTYPSDYRVCFNHYCKNYDCLCSSEVTDLMKLMPDDDVYVEFGYSFILGEFVFSLIRQVSWLDKDISYDFFDNSKYITYVLRLDEDNYVKVQIGCFDRYSFTFNSTTEKMDDVVNIFKHFFEMLDKNFSLFEMSYKNLNTK